MNASLTRNKKAERITALPLVTRDGVQIVTDLSFSVRDPFSNESYAYSVADLPCDDLVVASIYSILRQYLATKSLAYSRKSLSFIRKVVYCAAECEKGEVSELSLVHLDALVRDTNARGERGEFALSFAIPFLRRWMQNELPGLDARLRDFLSEPKSTSSEFQYAALRTSDPERGPLTEQELRSLHSTLNQAFSDGKVTLQEFLLAWLFIGTGARPVQISRMRIQDVRFESGPDGTEVYLDVPLAKGEGAYTGARWGRRSPTVLAEIFAHARSLNWLARPSESPLFAGPSGAPIPPGRLSQALVKVFNGLDTYSARLDGPIPVFPYRFRYSVGTRAIAFGANDHQVARLLTHRSTFSVKHYRAATPGTQKALAASLGNDIDTIAKVFQGKVIPDFASATRGDDVDALLRDFERLSGRSVGACGTRAACYQHAPIACLTCRYFEAFENAPFSELVAAMREDQQREHDPRIASIYDTAISAGEELINRQLLGVTN